MSPGHVLLAAYTTFNQNAWPAWLFWYGLAAIAVVLLLQSNRVAPRFTAGFLTAYSVWIGVAFFWILYAPIHSFAWFDGALFLLQGALFFFAGVIRSDLSFERLTRSGPSLFGAAAMAYVLIPYPFIGALEGHSFPGEPIFGISPCATAIFTVGLLLWSRQRLPTYLLFVPLGWALAAWINMIPMTIWQDAFGLSIFAAGGVAVLMWRDRTTLRRTLPVGMAFAVMALASGHDDWEFVIVLIFVTYTFILDLVDRRRAEGLPFERAPASTSPA
jgi:hypothetical protein